MHTFTEIELQKYAHSLASTQPPKHHHLFLLSGTLGAGKTTFSKAFLQGLSITDPIQSPTYTLGNTYTTPTHTVYHLDLYRLESLSDYMHLGFHDILMGGFGLWLIEWPELLLEELAPVPYTHLTLHTTEDPERRTLTVHEHLPTPWTTNEIPPSQ